MRPVFRRITVDMISEPISSKYLALSTCLTVDGEYLIEVNFGVESEISSTSDS